MDWGQVCPTSYCDSASQSPVAINTTDVQTCNGHLQLSSGYGGKLKGHFEREGHRLQFAIDNWATDGPTVTQSHSMHNTEYRHVYLLFLKKVSCIWKLYLIFWYRIGSYFGSHHILGHITSRLPHQLTTKPCFYCVPTVFLYVVVEFVELTWHIRHDPKCENRWNFFFKPIFCHELHEILTNGFSHCNRGFLKLQMLFYDFCS